MQGFMKTIFNPMTWCELVVFAINRIITKGCAGATLLL